MYASKFLKSYLVTVRCRSSDYFWNCHVPDDRLAESSDCIKLVQFSHLGLNNSSDKLFSFVGLCLLVASTGSSFGEEQYNTCMPDIL